MNEISTNQFLSALRRAMSATHLYPAEHPNSKDSVKGLVLAVADLVDGTPGVTISVIDGAIYSDRNLLPNTTLEFRDLTQTFQNRGLESVGISEHASERDLLDLARFLSSGSEDAPIEGTVTLNEKPFSKSDMVAAASLSGLRKSYASSIDVLQGVSSAVEIGDTVELSSSMWAIEGLLEQVMSQRGASLLLSTLKTHDQYTFFHSVNTSILAIAVGRSLGFSDDDLIAVGVGALLHDVGKVRVPQETIQYPGRLDAEQWNQIKKHPQEGAQVILAGVGPQQEIAAMVALEHHARFDMSGYPTISGKAKPHVFSRIVSVCDVYDALTTRRSYKRAEPPHRALQMLLELSGDHLDPALVDAFVQMMGVYPVGSILRLDDGSTVMVVDANRTGETVLAIPVARDVERISEVDAIEVPTGRVAGLVLPEQIGIHPAALLEDIHVTDLAA
jgi:putative nucleotidyltransferase with HDIG domain